MLAEPRPQGPDQPIVELLGLGKVSVGGAGLQVAAELGHLGGQFFRANVYAVNRFKPELSPTNTSVRAGSGIK